MVARPYDGQAGRTAFTETTIWCGGCGAWFGGRVLQTLDGDADAELLAEFVGGGFAAVNAAQCPNCNWTYTAEEPLTVHLPSQNKLFLVIPENGRHRAQEARARVISAVAGNPGSFVPGYALEPVLVAGTEQLSAFMGSVPAGRKPGRGARTIDEDTQGAEPIFAQAPKLDESDLKDISEQPRPVTGRLSGLLAAVLGEEEDEEPEGSSSGEGWSLASVVEDRSDSEPTNVMHRSAITERRSMVESIDEESTEVIDEHAVELLEDSEASLSELGDSTQAFRTSTEWIEYDGKEVRLIWSATEADAVWMESAHLEIRFQQLAAPEGRAWILTLFERLDDRSVRDVACWRLEPGNESHDTVVGALAERFEVEIACSGSGGEFPQRRRLTPPLEENVARALDRIADRGDAAALDHVLAKSYDRCGKPQHNFKKDSFLDLKNAGEVRLGLGIVGYWSLENLTAHLLDVLSFPVVWFDAMVKRVLVKAVEMGLAMEPHLRRIAVDEGLATDEAELLHRLVHNFGEHMLLPDRSGLDLIEQWENWERLLTWADVMGVEIPTHRQSQALAALEAAHAAESDPMGDGPGQGGVIELSIRDALVVESMNASVSLASEQGQTAWDELTDTSLVEPLQGDGLSPQPVYELLRRSDHMYAPAVLEAIWRLPPKAMEVALTMLVERAGAYADLLAAELASSWPQSALAAVVMAELSDERSVAPLLEMLESRDGATAAVLEEAVARVGASVIDSLFAEDVVTNVPGERLARILFMLGRDVVAGLDGKRLGPAAGDIIARAKQMIDSGGPYGRPAFEQWVPSVVAAVNGPGGS